MTPTHDRAMSPGSIDERAPRDSRGAFLVRLLRRRAALAAGLALALAGAGCAGSSPAPAPPTVAPAPPAFAREEPFVVRPYRPFLGDRWIGNGIAYGPHRDGQRPGGPEPSRAQLREDLALLLPHWNLLRVYGSAGPAESLLAVIDEERLPMKVMLGVWIDPEDRRDDAGRIVERLPDGRAANRREIETAVRLARSHPSTVIALCAGNETQVDWSAHRVPADLLIATVRELRARTALPVTTADDYNFWNKPASRAVAREVDLVVTHMHPMWNGLALEDAMDWTARTFASIRAAHPDREVVLGETGWATRKHTEGEQATLIKGTPGEAEQRTFFRAFDAWVRRERVASFYFEAFDENWKGGSHPDEVEKHWGLFRADRTPKAAIAGEPGR